MVTMVKLHYPEKIRLLTDQELRSVIHSGVIRAKQYDIDLTNDTERFVRLMFRFRSFVFEQDPLTAWTQEVLRDETLSAAAKLDQIEGQALLFQLIAEENFKPNLAGKPGFTWPRSPTQKSIPHSMMRIATLLGSSILPWSTLLRENHES